jgi:uncharacterized protein (TIGR01777 family)
MKIVLAGATGFIGTALVRRLHARGDMVVVLTRNAAPTPGGLPEGVRPEYWDGKRQGAWSAALDGADAVVNLAGASIGSGRWTKARKEELLRSRIEPTRALVQACALVTSPPSMFVSASAVGFYHPTGDAPVTEEDPSGTGFLAELARQWEGEARTAERSGMRVVITRFGIVLGQGGGALERMLLPFRLFAGGPLGSGKQWFPWVHVDDVVGTILFALDSPRLSGPVNVVAPDLLTMGAFARILGEAMHRPSWLPVPAFALRLLLGEMSVIVLGGRPVVPAKLVEAGYPFAYSRIPVALRSLL